jgi:putative flippase GtrA
VWKLWLRFCCVGVMGSVVQTAMMYLGRDLLGWHYLWATVLAVEVTLGHNFVWHEHWTWGTKGLPDWGRRAWKYQLGTGTVALVANLFAAELLVGRLGLPTLVATPLAIGGSGLVNFLIGQFVVFRKVACSSPDADS